jgi:hypothetical protein
VQNVTTKLTATISRRHNGERVTEYRGVTLASMARNTLKRSPCVSSDGVGTAVRTSPRTITQLHSGAREKVLPDAAAASVWISKKCNVARAMNGFPVKTPYGCTCRPTSLLGTCIAPYVAKAGLPAARGPSRTSKVAIAAIAKAKTGLGRAYTIILGNMPPNCTINDICVTPVMTGCPTFRTHVPIVVGSSNSCRRKCNTNATPTVAIGPCDRLATKRCPFAYCLLLSKA